MKFRLTSLLWAFALLASALATFSGAGILLAIFVVGMWLLFFSETRFDPTGCFVAMFAVVLLLALLAANLRNLPEDIRYLQCMNNMKQLSLALLNYESANGQFPAAAQSDPNGEYKHSWRIWISPYFESANFYSAYLRNEPWNSLSNTKTLDAMGPSRAFACPSHDIEDQSTHYFAIVGENTAWPPDRGRSMREIRDGTSNTILLIEAPHRSVPWAKPVDLSFEEAVELLTNPPKNEDFGHECDEGFFHEPSQGINVAFCDGHVQLLRLPVPKDYAVAMLTADGGEDLNTLRMWQVRNPELDYGRVYGLCMFVLLSLAPVWRLRVKKQGATVKLTEEENEE